MDWAEYKQIVHSSRAQIAIPTIVDHLSGTHGLGVDLGCGDGEIAAKVCQRHDVSIIGIDIDADLIYAAQQLKLNNARFHCYNLASHPMRKIGVLFDFAYSNCCLNHLEDHEVPLTLDDLRSSMRHGARLVLLVPHWKRAAQRYTQVKDIPNGVSAIPDYGRRQMFRYGEWYCKAIEAAGFQVDIHKDILILDLPELCVRYQQCIGEPIFSLVVAHALDAESQSLSRTKAFDIAHDNRKFEIDMFWRRSIFYWGFIAASFVGFVATEKNIGNASIIFAAFGFLCSLAWSAGNRGSKYWQEYWEKKVVHLQNLVTGDLFIDHHPERHSWFNQFAPRRFSVSKLIMGISDYTVLLWLGILLFKLVSHATLVSGSARSLLLNMFIVGTIVYGLTLLYRCRSTD